MGPVNEWNAPPGLLLRSSRIFSIEMPGWNWSLACIQVSTETVSPEAIRSFGGSFGSSQPHWTVSGVAARRWCFPAAEAVGGSASATAARAARNDGCEPASIGASLWFGCGADGSADGPPRETARRRATRVAWTVSKPQDPRDVVLV